MSLTFKLLTPPILFIVCVLSVFAQQGTSISIVDAPLADSIRAKIQEQQRIERLNFIIDSLSNNSECEQIQEATSEEREYCHSRFSLIHSEAE